MRLFLISSCFFLLACSDRDDSTAEPPTNQPSSASSYTLTILDSKDGHAVIQTTEVSPSGTTHIIPMSKRLNRSRITTNCSATILKDEEKEAYFLDNKMLIDDCQVKIIYESVLPHSHLITINKWGSGGSIPTTTLSVQNGQLIKIPYIADEGFKAVIEGCGGVQEDDFYTIKKIFHDCEIHANFIPKASDLVSVTVLKNAGGYVYPEYEEVAAGHDHVITILPSEGYYAAVEGCGAYIFGEERTARITAIKDSCTAKIKFYPIDPTHQQVTLISGRHSGPVTAKLKLPEQPLEKVVFDQFRVPNETEFILTLENNYHQNIIDASGCNGIWDMNTLSLFVPRIKEDCEISLHLEDSQHPLSDRFMNIESEVFPPDSGTVTPVSIKVFSGTGFQTFIKASPGYRLESIEGCTYEDPKNTGIHEARIITNNITKQCKLSVTFSEIDLPEPEIPILIAHAGGGYNGSRYRNSLEAMNKNYELGHRYFEIDFSWTSDRKLVAIHDWDLIYRLLFPAANHSVPPTYETFVNLTMLNSESQMTLVEINDWLNDHRDAYIITDIKENNIEGLSIMKEALGENSLRIIPQMYQTGELETIRKMGYRNVIFTLYMTSEPTDELIKYIQSTDLFAVTISPYKKDFQTIVDKSKESGKPVFVHTFNEIDDLEHFRNLNVDGLYTDFLYPLVDGNLGKQ